MRQSIDRYNAALKEQRLAVERLAAEQERAESDKCRRHEVMEAMEAIRRAAGLASDAKNEELDDADRRFLAFNIQGHQFGGMGSHSRGLPWLEMVRALKMREDKTVHLRTPCCFDLKSAPTASTPREEAWTTRDCDSRERLGRPFPPTRSLAPRLVCTFEPVSQQKFRLFLGNSDQLLHPLPRTQLNPNQHVWNHSPRRTRRSRGRRT